ncbi:hypothetical protein C8Q77DRAFT_1128759 [Trametes polyzona]|nr:hypothetical protein C8Q77DRAFT_1128759 [Trametes polyzona]
MGSQSDRGTEECGECAGDRAVENICASLGFLVRFESFTMRRQIEVITASGILSTRMEMKESQHRPDKTDETKQRIDAALFRPQHAQNDGRPHWADQMVAVEFKRGGNDTDRDPFEDVCDNKVDADAEGRKKVRGQLIDYAENIFRYQHRTALFMLLVIGRRCRFLRWDRSGTLVTRSMDYYEENQLFCEMLWRMSMLDDEQLGRDPSATRICPRTAEYNFMNQIAVPKKDDLDHAERVLDEVPSGYVTYRYVREMFCQSLLGDWPRYKLQVVEGNKKYHFLVGKPVFQASGMAGRGTQGFVAWDCERERFVWLKDAWRAFYELVDQEGTILRLLNSNNVKFVPTVYCHGDVLGQTTLTPKYWEMKNPPSLSVPDTPQCSSPSMPLLPVPSSSRTLAGTPPSSSKGRKRSIAEVDDESNNTLLPSGLDADCKKTSYRDDCPLRRHMHYRLVVDEVAMPLKEFQSAWQLVAVILDCIVAHETALEQAGLMHRDVSGGNILIYPRVDPNTAKLEWTGLLADWELSKPIVQDGQMPRARQPERTGTWQFMSVAVLTDHGKPVETTDELESFFHVLLYYAIRYLPSNCSNVGRFIENFFDSYHCSDAGQYSCGSRKRDVMTGQTKLTTDEVRLNTDEVIPVILKFDSSALNDIIDTVLTWFNAHYRRRDHREKERRRLRAMAALPPPTKAPSAASKLGATRTLRHAVTSLPRHHKIRQQDEIAPLDALTEAYADDAALHQALRNLLGDRLAELDRWVEDRVPGTDNVPANYKAQCPLGPKAGTARDSVKRLKTGPQTAAPLRERTTASMALSMPPIKWDTYF